MTVSHLEAGMTVPGERTIALLAGVFGMEPGELVADSDYPRAKSDRLPTVVARYTEVQFQLGLMDAELAYLAELPIGHVRNRVAYWRRQIRLLASGWIDQRERSLLEDGLRRLDTWTAISNTGRDRI